MLAALGRPAVAAEAATEAATGPVTKTVTVAAVRFGQTADRTRVVFDLSAPVPFTCRLAADGRTVIVTLAGADWRPPRHQLLHDAGPLADYDVEAGQVTLRANLRMRLVSAVTLSPEPHLPFHRIVIDLAVEPEPEAGQTTRPEAGQTAEPQATVLERGLERGVRAALGRDGPPDYVAASEAFRSAALAGSSQAAFNLGELYRAGKGVPQDYGQAAAWFSRAAAAGFAPAQFYLAVLVFNGAGVPRDRQRVRDLLEQAAAQGLPEARQALEELRRADNVLAEHRPN